MIFLSMIFLSIYRHLTKNSGLGKGMESAAAATDDDMRCDFGRSDASSTPYFLAVSLSSEARFVCGLLFSLRPQFPLLDGGRPAASLLLEAGASSPSFPRRPSNIREAVPVSLCVAHSRLF